MVFLGGSNEKRKGGREEAEAGVVASSRRKASGGFFQPQTRLHILRTCDDWSPLLPKLWAPSVRKDKRMKDNISPFHCGLPMVSGDHVSHHCLKCLVCGATSGCSESLEHAALELPKESHFEGDPRRFDLAG